MRTSEKNDADVLKGGESMNTKDDDKLQETNRKSAKGKGVMSRFMGVILAAAVAFGTFGAGVGMWLIRLSIKETVLTTALIIL